MRPERVDDVEHRDLRAATDVHRARGLGLGRLEIGVDDVADVDVVARLPPVAEDGGPLAVEELAAEDGDDAGLAEGVLAGAVDVAVAERDGGEAVEPGEELAVLLGAELAQAVGSLG